MPGTPASRNNDSAQPHHQRSGSHGAWLAMIVCTVLLTSCGSSGSTQQVGKIINRPITTTGCDKAAPTRARASIDQMIDSGGLSRSYRLHLPTGYSMKQPQALILAFHGYSVDVHGFEPSSGFSRLSDQQGFIVVYPQGTGNPSAWASGGAGDPSVDDVLFVSDLLNHLQTTLYIDAQRIYATGASNGGGLVGNWPNALLRLALWRGPSILPPVAVTPVGPCLFWSFMERPTRSCPTLTLRMAGKRSLTGSMTG